MSPIAHTLQKETTPSSWRQRERAQEGNGGEQRTQRQETKCKARQVLETTETHAAEVVRDRGDGGLDFRLETWRLVKG